MRIFTKFTQYPGCRPIWRHKCIETTHWKFERLRLAVKTMEKSLLLPYLLATGGYHRSCAHTHRDRTIGRRHLKGISSRSIALPSGAIRASPPLPCAVKKRQERLLNKYSSKYLSKGLSYIYIRLWCSTKRIYSWYTVSYHIHVRS